MLRTVPSAWRRSASHPDIPRSSRSRSASSIVQQCLGSATSTRWKDVSKRLTPPPDRLRARTPARWLLRSSGCAHRMPWIPAMACSLPSAQVATYPKECLLVSSPSESDSPVKAPPHGRSGQPFDSALTGAMISMVNDGASDAAGDPPRVGAGEMAPGEPSARPCELPQPQLIALRSCGQAQSPASLARRDRPRNR